MFSSLFSSEFGQKASSQDQCAHGENCTQAPRSAWFSCCTFGTLGHEGRKQKIQITMLRNPARCSLHMDYFKMAIFPGIMGKAGKKFLP